MAVEAVCLSAATSVCPKGSWLIHLSALAPGGGLSAEEVLQQVLNRLVPPAGEGDDAPSRLLHVTYFELTAMDPDRLDAARAAAPPGIALCSDAAGRSGLRYGECIAEAKRVFHSILPDEPFLPAAPNPEDVVWESSEEDTTLQGAEAEAAQLGQQLAALRRRSAGLAIRSRIATAHADLASAATDLERLREHIAAAAARTSSLSES